MSTPTTPVDICNLALDRIGQAPISSIDAPTTTPEKICARHYDQLRRELLRKYVFNFSKKYALLAADAAVTPAFGYDSAYQFPTDLLRILALGNIALNADVAPGLFDVVGRYIYTDYGDSTGLKIAYIFDETQVGNWDPLFANLAALALARKVSYKFSLKPSLVSVVMLEAEEAAVAATAVAGQEKPPRRVQRSRIRDARKQGGIHRDNRFI